MMRIGSKSSALVVGGGGGIGREISRRIARLGMPVGIADIREEDAAAAADAVRTDGGVAESAMMDLTSAESIDSGYRKLAAAIGYFGVVVISAGWDEMKPFVETDEEFWRRVVDINYLGVLRVLHRSLPAMIDAGWGRIVTIASDAGRVGSSLEATYSGAKGGTIAFTKALAREVARDGITANVVCPGPTDTPMLTAVIGGEERAARAMEGMARAVPLRRLGRPTDIAAAVAFLVSDDASYITGQTLSVNGGLNMV